MSVATKSDMILESTINQFTKYLREAFLPFIVNFKLTLLLISSLKLDFCLETNILIKITNFELNISMLMGYGYLKLQISE